MTQAQTPHAAAGASDAEAAEGRVYTVSGEDWDEIVSAANEAGGLRERRADRHQHGPAAPVHPRRAPAGPDPGGRDRRRGAAGHRLPAHRHREEHGVPHLDAGRHVLHQGGLPDADLQRGRVLLRGGAPARHRGQDPRAGPDHQGPDDGAQPDHLAPGRDRPDGPGAGRDHDLHAGRAAAGTRPRPAGADHRPADEPRLHQARRGGAGPAARSAGGDPRLPGHRAASSCRTCAR